MGCFGGGSQGTTTTTERAPTAEETEMNKLQLEMFRETAPGQTELQKSAIGLGKGLIDITNLQSLYAGISPEVTQGIVDQSLRDINPMFQASGIMDSGLAASISARTTADIRRASEEYNIGNRLNLLNLALSGQAQVQSPTLATSGQLRSSLATLGKTTGTSITTDNNTFGRQFMSSVAGMPSAFAGGAGSGFGAAMAGGCWVAKEVYGSWEDDRVHSCRFYIKWMAPNWFNHAYLTFGERFAKFISNKPIIKAVLKPLFDWMVYRANSRYVYNVGKLRVA